MKREVDVPLAGARAERGDGEPKGCLWFRGECSDTVKVAVPVELAAAVAMRGAKVRLVVEVEPEREAQGESAKVAGPWERTPNGQLWERRRVINGTLMYERVARVRKEQGYATPYWHWRTLDASGATTGTGTALAVQQAQDAADEILRADGWVLQ